VAAYIRSLLVYVWCTVRLCSLQPNSKTYIVIIHMQHILQLFNANFDVKFNIAF